MTNTFETMIGTERDFWAKNISTRLQGVIDKTKQVDEIVEDIISTLEDFYSDNVKDEVCQPIFDSLLELTAEIEKRVVFQILAENDRLEGLLQ